MMCGVGKDIGRACDFLGIWVEICSPPTEGTTGDDLVLASCHELHVAPAVIPTVPVNELDLVVLEVEPEHVAVLFRPFHTAWVAENIEVRIVHDAFDISYGPLEITPVVAVEVKTEHVAPAGVYGYRLLRLDAVDSGLVPFVVDRGKQERLSHFLVDFLYTAALVLEGQLLTSENVLLRLDEEFGRVWRRWLSPEVLLAKEV